MSSRSPAACSRAPGGGPGPAPRGTGAAIGDQRDLVTWLQQGRHISVSRQVIESLAADAADVPARAHLLAVAGRTPPARIASPPAVDDTRRSLVDTLHPNPAVVSNPW